MNRSKTSSKKSSPSSTITPKKVKKKIKPKSPGPSGTGPSGTTQKEPFHQLVDEQNSEDDVKHKNSKGLPLQRAMFDQSSDQFVDNSTLGPFTGASFSDNNEYSPASNTARRPRDTISLSLLAKRCINDYQKLKPDKIMQLLNEITHVRLDRENLQSIDGLELLGPRVRNLYLQHNEIKEIAGLETLTELRFLTLSHNNISEIRNLKNTKLGFLDLSHNSIEYITVEELPMSLVILNLEGNRCQLTDELRDSILKHCHQLSQLNGELLTVDERRAAGHEVTSDSEESDDETNQAAAPYNYDRPFDAEVVGVFDDLSSDLFLRCQARIQHVFDEHKTRVLSMERIKADGGIATEDGAASNPASRISSRLDSPDTTDSSRPDTGNNPIDKGGRLVDFETALSDMPVISDALSSDVDLVTSRRQVHVAVRGGVTMSHNSSSSPSTLQPTLLQQAQAWEDED